MYIVSGRYRFDASGGAEIGSWQPQEHACHRFRGSDWDLAFFFCSVVSAQVSGCVGAMHTKGPSARMVQLATLDMSHKRHVGSDDVLIAKLGGRINSPF